MRFCTLIALIMCMFVTFGCFLDKRKPNASQRSLSPFSCRQLEDSISFFLQNTQDVYPCIELDKVELIIHKGTTTTVSACLSPEFGIPMEKITCIGGCFFNGKKMIVFSDTTVSALFDEKALDISKAYEFVGEDIISGFEREAQGIVKEWRLINDSTLVLNKTIEIRMTPSKMLRGKETP